MKLKRYLNLINARQFISCIFYFLNVMHVTPKEKLSCCETVLNKEDSLIRNTNTSDLSSCFRFQQSLVSSQTKVGSR